MYNNLHHIHVLCCAQETDRMCRDPRRGARSRKSAGRLLVWPRTRRTETHRRDSGQARNDVWKCTMPLTCPHRPCPVSTPVVAQLDLPSAAPAPPGHTHGTIEPRPPTDPCDPLASPRRSTTVHAGHVRVSAARGGCAPACKRRRRCTCSAGPSLASGR